MKDKLVIAGIFFAIVLVVGGFIYGAYMVAKTVSYNLFYEDMVRPIGGNRRRLSTVTV